MIFNQVVSGGAKESRIPSAYQEVSWIAGTGTQYIDTGIQASNDVQINISFALTNTSNTSKIFGMYIQNNQTDVLDCYNNKFRFVPYGSGWNSGTISTDLNWHYVTWRDKNGRYTFDGELVDTKTNVWSSDKTYYLFNSNSDSIPAYMRLKSFVMTQNSTSIKLREFVPCYRKSDNVVGLYDLVSNTFFQNIGTGDFISGEKISNGIISPITITSNGIFSPPTGVDGYSPVTVNVQASTPNFVGEFSFSETSYTLPVINLEEANVDYSNATSYNRGLKTKYISYGNLSSWELCCCFSGYQHNGIAGCLFGSVGSSYYYNPSLEIQTANKIWFGSTSASTYWTLYDEFTLSSPFVETNVYQIKFGWNGSKVYVKVTDKTTNTQIGYKELSSATNPQGLYSSSAPLCLCNNAEGSTSRFSFTGKLLLLGSYIKENGIITWGADKI